MKLPSADKILTSGNLNLQKMLRGALGALLVTIKTLNGHSFPPHRGGYFWSQSIRSHYRSGEIYLVMSSCSSRVFFLFFFIPVYSGSIGQRRMFTPSTVSLLRGEEGGADALGYVWRREGGRER